MILSIPTVSGNSMWPVLLVLGGTAVMMMLLRRRGSRARLSGREMIDEQKERFLRRRDSHRAADDLLVQLEELARRIGADVDTRYAKLEAVIRDADERIARLERLAERLGIALETDTPTARGGRTPASAGGRPSSAGRPSADRATRETAGKAASDSPASAAPMNDDPRFRAIYELVDAGATPIAAAEKLGLPLGEVELILDLRRMG